MKWQYLVIILVILLLFGAPKLPGLAKSLGQSMRIFRKEVKGLDEDRAADEAVSQPQQQAIAPQSVPTTAEPVQQPAAVQQPAGSTVENSTSSQSNA
jgi:sec-independent protein translocase protein TatA